MNDPAKREVIVDVISLYRAGADVERLLAVMRERGFSETDSVEPIMEVLCLDRGDARNLVIESRTWADHYQDNLKLQEDLLQALLELSEERDDFTVVIEPDDSEKE